jgi:hypothetical protein
MRESQEGSREPSQRMDETCLQFNNTTLCGLKVATLVDTSATHNFIGEQIVKSLHCKT